MPVVKWSKSLRGGKHKQCRPFSPSLLPLVAWTRWPTLNPELFAVVASFAAEEDSAIAWIANLAKVFIFTVTCNLIIVPS